MLSNSENTTSKGNSNLVFDLCQNSDISHAPMNSSLTPVLSQDQVKPGTLLSSSPVNLLAVSEKSKDCDNYQLS